MVLTGPIIRLDTKLVWPAVATWAQHSVLQLPDDPNVKFTERRRQALKYTQNVAYSFDVTCKLPKIQAGLILQSVRKYDVDMFVWLTLGKESVLNRGTVPQNVKDIYALLLDKGVRVGVMGTWEYENLIPNIPFFSTLGVSRYDIRVESHERKFGLFSKSDICVVDSRLDYDKIF